MSIRFLSALLALATVVLPAGCSRQRPRKDGHEQMLRLLADIKNQARFEDEYFEESSVQIGELDLQSLPHDTPRDERLEMLWNVGVGQLRLGRNEEAIQQYERLLKIKPRLADVHHNCAYALMAAGRPYRILPAG